MDRSVIDQYRSAGGLLREAIAGLTEQELLQQPPADAPAELGRWSIQQVAIHLVDAEMVYAERMKRVIAEDTPRLIGFDEAQWAARLNYERQSAADAADLVERVRRQTARMLAGLPDAAFDRRGIHDQAGSVTLNDLIVQIIRHLEHHVRFIARKRQWLGR